MTTSELFVPRRAPFSSFMTKTKCTNIKLHVRRGFIMDYVDEFVPEWLKCVIPRNISLESLQENEVLRGMNKNLAKNCFEMFADIAENGHGSTKSGAEQLNLKEYVDTMKEGQNDICNVNGESISESIVEQIADVPVPQIMEELVGVEITNDLSEDGAVEDAGVKIEGVAISKRLTHSPVEGTSEFGYSTQQEKGHQSMQGSLENLETRMQDAHQVAD